MGAVIGAVLCGGASRRMGTDKALLLVDGEPMAARVASAMSGAGVESVLAVGGDVAGLEAAGLTVVADRWPGEGPLGGIVTALGAAGPSTVVIVAACDLLDPRPDAMRRLLTERHRTDADVVVPVVDGRRQWGHAVWHGRVAPLVTEIFEAGGRAVAAAADGLRTVVVPADAHVGADADTPADLQGWTGTGDGQGA